MKHNDDDAELNVIFKRCATVVTFLRIEADMQINSALYVLTNKKHK